MAQMIGMIGLAGAGKDTVAEMLRDALVKKGKTVRIDRFAALLKQATEIAIGPDFDDRATKEDNRMVPWTGIRPALAMLARELGLSFQALSDAASKAFYPYQMSSEYLQISSRRFQQLIGTDVVRSVKDSAWVDYICNKHYTEDVVIIADCRFPNEELRLPCTIFVHRPGVEVQEHISEKMAGEYADKFQAYQRSMSELGGPIAWSKEADGDEWHIVINNLSDLAYLRGLVEGNTVEFICQ